MKKQWIILCTFLLSGCQNNKPKPTCDYIKYTDYTFKNYFIEDKKAITIDFKNDVFNHGNLKSMDGNSYDLDSSYDSLIIYIENKDESPLKIKKISPFVYRFSTDKKFYSVCTQLQVSLYNSKKNIRSYYMNVGNIYCYPERKNYVEINTIDDFKKIKTYSTVILKSDIDFKDFDFNHNTIVDVTCRQFDGIFINPEKYVIKNINYNSTNKYDDSYLFFYITFSAFFDSLIFENVTYQRTIKDESQDYFGLITSNSIGTTFQNIQMNNIYINYSSGMYGSLTGRSEWDNFINNEVNGKIVCKLLDEEKTKLNVSGGLASTYCRVTINSLNYWFDYTNSNYYFVDKYYKGQKNAESSISRFEEYYNKAPQINIISNNKLNIDIDGDFIAGGIFGTVDNDNIDQRTINTGKITGENAGERYGMNYLYWANYIDWDTTPYK